MPIQNTVFICYRRKDTQEAYKLFKTLQDKGYDVFLETDVLEGNETAQRVSLNQIAARAHCLIVITPHALDDTTNTGDTMRREIERAIDLKRNVIPLLYDGFELYHIQHLLPGALMPLLSLEPLRVPSDYFEEAMMRLTSKRLQQPLEISLYPAPPPEQTLVAQKIATLKSGSAPATPSAPAGTPAVTPPSTPSIPTTPPSSSSNPFAALGSLVGDGAPATPFTPPSSDPMTADDYYNRAMSRDRNDWDGKIADYTEAIRLNPNFAEAYVNRGVSRNAKGDVDGAIEDYSGAIRVRPDYALAYSNRSDARRIKGDYDGALQDALKAVELNPTSANAYRNLGVAYYNKGDLANANRSYQKYIDLGGDEAEKVAGWIRDNEREMKKGKSDDGGMTARDYFERGLNRPSDDLQGKLNDYTMAIQLNPEYAEAYNNRAGIKINLGDNEGAFADADKSIQLGNRHYTVYYNRGTARHNMGGDLEMCIADYTEAIRLNPNDPLAYNNRGNARSDKGDKDGAIEDYTMAIRLNPNNALAHNNRGIAYYDKEDYDKAIEDYTAAIKIDPNYAMAYNNRGNAWLAKNDPDTAIQDYNKAIEIAPRYALAYMNRGVAFRRKGDLVSANANYQKYIDFGGPNVEKVKGWIRDNENELRNRIN